MHAHFAAKAPLHAPLATFMHHLSGMPQTPCTYTPTRCTHTLIFAPSNATATSTTTTLHEHIHTAAVLHVSHDQHTARGPQHLITGTFSPHTPCAGCSQTHTTWPQYNHSIEPTCNKVHSRTHIHAFLCIMRCQSTLACASGHLYAPLRHASDTMYLHPHEAHTH